jgi:hypothetical protein
MTRRRAAIQRPTQRCRELCPALAPAPSAALRASPRRRASFACVGFPPEGRAAAGRFAPFYLVGFQANTRRRLFVLKLDPTSLTGAGPQKRHRQARRFCSTIGRGFYPTRPPSARQPLTPLSGPGAPVPGAAGVHRTACGSLRPGRAHNVAALFGSCARHRPALVLGHAAAGDAMRPALLCAIPRRLPLTARGPFAALARQQPRGLTSWALFRILAQPLHAVAACAARRLASAP